MRSEKPAKPQPDTPLEQLKLLADEARWQLLQALRRSDCQVGELVEQTGYAQNLVSYHLGILRHAGLVTFHRSDADARTVYYGLNLLALAAIYRQLGAVLSLTNEPTACTELPPRTIVFLCRANSARSQMAEGWLRALSGGRVVVRSAGTEPSVLHPTAAVVMAEVGLDIGYQAAKHVDTLAALNPDVVVTVCDIAREQCAVWAKAGAHLHWSVSDPVAAPEAGHLAAFRAVRDELQQRVEGLLCLLPTLAGTP